MALLLAETAVDSCSVIKLLISVWHALETLYPDLALVSIN
jgi:hypothetical protein